MEGLPAEITCHIWLQCYHTFSPLDFIKSMAAVACTCHRFRQEVYIVLKQTPFGEVDGTCIKTCGPLMRMASLITPVTYVKNVVVSTVPQSLAVPIQLYDPNLFHYCTETKRLHYKSQDVLSQISGAYYTTKEASLNSWPRPSKPDVTLFQSYNYKFVTTCSCPRQTHLIYTFCLDKKTVQDRVQDPCFDSDTLLDFANKLVRGTKENRPCGMYLCIKKFDCEVTYNSAVIWCSNLRNVKPVYDK